jgi:alpha-mannosidase
VEPSGASDDHVLDNGIVAARVDAATGSLASLRIAGSGELARPGTHAVAIDDASDTWGHDVVAFDGAETPFDVVSIDRVEHGPARTVIRVISRCGASTLVEDWSLGRDDDYIDIAITLDWHERARLCKLRFPTALRAGEVAAESAYAAVRRASDGSEQPMQRWVDVSGSGGGVAIANDGKSGYDAIDAGDGVDVGITVARGVVYAWHQPAVLDPRATYRWMDQGEQRFRLRLIPHAGPLADAVVPRRAAELNQRPSARIDTFHGGALGRSATFASIDGDASVEIVVWKRAEDGCGDVVRVCETAGVAAQFRATIWSRSVVLDLTPYQVMTLRIPDDDSDPVAVVDLCEWAPGERPPGQVLPTARPMIVAVNGDSATRPT